MHLTPTGLLVASVNSPFQENARPHEQTGYEDHGYIRGDASQRAPCPGLNCLANQGYLPRDGKNLTIPMVHTALTKTLRMSPAAATSLTNNLPPFLRADGTFDLIDLRRHGVLEHDASLTRLDFRQGDNYTFQPHMLEAMIRDANGGDVTLRSLAVTFRRRQRESREAGAPALGWKLWFVSMFEAVAVINAVPTNMRLTREVLEAVYADERFPDIILDDPAPKTLLRLFGNALGMLYWCVVGA